MEIKNNDNKRQVCDLRSLLAFNFRRIVKSIEVDTKGYFWLQEEKLNQ